MEPQNRQNHEKKAIQKSTVFGPPSERGSDDFCAQKCIQNELKMRSKKAEGEETAKNAKTSNLEYIPRKTPIFQDPKTYKIQKNLRKCMQKPKLAQRSPSRSDF